MDKPIFLGINIIKQLADYCVRNGKFFEHSYATGVDIEMR
jgi:hypothetical protein